MPRFDWNGNKKSDAFDHYMDMKVMSETSKNSKKDSPEGEDAEDEGTMSFYPTSEKSHTSSSQQDKSSSSGETIVKSILCILLCVIGFAFMVNVEGVIGPLILLGAVFLGYKIMSS